MAYLASHHLTPHQAAFERLFFCPKGVPMNPPQKPVPIMSRVIAILQGVLLLLASVLVFLLPPVTLFAVLLARWDKQPTRGTYDTVLTIRGDVPGWLRWLQTNDERLPGGLHEPTVLRVFKRFGRVVCSWYWIGWRNRAHGLRRVFGLPSTESMANIRFPVVDGKASGTRPDGTWYWSRDFWRLRAVAGHRIYMLPTGFMAVPAFTIKFGGGR